MAVKVARFVGRPIRSIRSWDLVRWQRDVFCTGRTVGDVIEFGEFDDNELDCCVGHGVLQDAGHALVGQQVVRFRAAIDGDQLKILLLK